jgi:hypothetical protein
LREIIIISLPQLQPLLITGKESSPEAAWPLRLVDGA